MMKRGLRLAGDVRLHLPALVLVALFARLLFLVVSGSYGRVINHDATEYLDIAESLLAGFGFAFGPGQPTAFRPFGYPFLIAAVFGIVGARVAPFQSMQAALGALLVVPTYAIARRLAGHRVALLAGLGVALHPVLLYLPAVIAPETAAMLLQLLALWSALLILERKDRRWQALVGYILCSAAAALMRPEFLLVSGLVAVGLLVWLGAGSRRLQVLLSATILAVLLTIGPPTLRNWRTFDAFIPFPTVGGVTFWGGNNALAGGGWILPTAQNWPTEDAPSSMRGWPKLTEQQSQARFYRSAYQWMEAHPSDLLGLIPRKLIRSWTLSFSDEGRSPSLPWIVEVANWLFGAVVLAGMILARHRYRPAWWLLFAPVIAWVVKTVLFYGSARQTAPILPVLCIFAAVTLETAAVHLIPALRRGRAAHLPD
jgi:4-amino-4-deoxy-L-arabinose transferase-like glycosyltransferase